MPDKTLTFGVACLTFSAIVVPHEGSWKEIFNTDDKIYWGSGMNNSMAIKTDKNSWHGRKHSVLVTLPPLSVIVLKQDK